MKPFKIKINDQVIIAFYAGWWKFYFEDIEVNRNYFTQTQIKISHGFIEENTYLLVSQLEKLREFKSINSTAEILQKLKNVNQELDALISKYEANKAALENRIVVYRDDYYIKLFIYLISKNSKFDFFVSIFSDEFEYYSKNVQFNEIGEQIIYSKPIQDACELYTAINEAKDLCPEVSNVNPDYTEITRNLVSNLRTRSLGHEFNQLIEKHKCQKNS